jgi:aerobic carbon-monoxide dehydrogenase medium subunit
MIPVAFDYLKPATVDDAVAALASGGDDAKVIAGGQSLLPVLRLRLAAPSLLVDLDGPSGLRGIRVNGDVLAVGAMTTHAEIAASPVVREHVPLLAAAATMIGDRQVRHRGTIGGSLAHADPAGDFAAVLVALDGECVVAGPDGRRTIGAGDFFVDYFTTALGLGEIIVEVRLPIRPGWGVHYEKFMRTAQSWAMVGVAAAVRRENGSIAEARVALTNMGSGPIRATAVEAALAGADASAEALAGAAEHAAEGTAARSDLSASAEFREHLARVLTRRALATAAGL